MIIKKIKALEFGKLSNYESPELSDNINVFYGRNEAGKSTVFSIITTLLYGFNPASRENNPYVSWERDEACCEGKFILDDGKEINILRQLRSRAEGKITGDSKVRIINNNPLEFTGNISREIFSEAFAMTQDKLGIPDEKLWQKLQEQLFGGQYSSFIRPTAQVCSEIETEASNLWKDDNRGKPRDKELTLKIRELNGKLSKAREIEKKVYEERAELEKLENEIEILKKKKYEYTVCLDKMDKVIPAFKKIKAIEAMKNEAGDIEKFNGIPDKPMDALKELDNNIEKIEQKVTELQNQLEDNETVIRNYNPVYAKVLNIRDKISTAVKTQGFVISNIESIKNLERQRDTGISGLYSTWDKLLRGGFKKELAFKFKEIDYIELKESIDNFKAIEKKINEQEMRNSALSIKLKGGKKSKFLLAAAAAAFLFGLILLFILKAVEFKITGGIFSASGFMIFIYYFFISPNKALEIELMEGEKLIKKYQKQKEEAVDGVKLALSDLPFGDMRVNNPDETLLIDVKEVKDIILKLEGITLQLQKEKDELSLRKGDISGIFEALGLSSTENIISDIEKLELILDEAADKTREYEASISEVKKIENEKINYNSELEDLKRRRDEIIALLNKIDGESLMQKAESLAKRRKQSIKASALEEELKDSEDYNSIREEIAAALDTGEKWIYSDEEAIRIKLEKEDIDKQLFNELEKSGSLKSTIEQMEDAGSIDDITGEIEYCEDEKKEIAFKRDRLIFLKNIITEADRRFKEEHQPDILFRGGNYLEKITAGKYDKIYASEDGGPGLMIRCSEDNSIIAAKHPLSRGTLEQIYFCLRLALLDHLDSFSEKLPVFMDETFINWDSIRIEKGIEIMKDIAANRQVIIFTCHSWFMDLLKKETGCRVIDML